MQALIIVDMLDDFVTGPLANERNASAIIPGIRALIDHALARPDWLVVYSNDAHREDDPEMAVWGRHAMAGTPGAQVIPALAPTGAAREIVSPKRHYGAFEGTGLEEAFQRHGVTGVVLTGQHTNCCVRHTAYGAFVRGLRIAVPEDAVCVPEGGDQAAALDYLRAMYGAKITTVSALIGAAPARAAAE